MPFVEKNPIAKEGDERSGTSRRNLAARNSIFAVVLMLVLGSMVVSWTEIEDDKVQLAQINAAEAQLAPQVKEAQYHQAKLYQLAKEVLRLSDTDQIAATVVREFKIKEMQNPGGATTTGTTSPPSTPVPDHY